MDIEKAKKICKAYINAIDTFGTIDYKCINNLYEPIEVVLSELEQKDSLINEQLKENVRLQNELNEENKRCMILANNDKFKEQVIDEMAIYINNFDSDEDICKYQIGQFCKNEACEVTASTCCQCIKQYFTKKVEGK